ncbi:MAG: penicillin-binding protein activator LpoB [Culturomica sp.]|jgi:hypothetical protein|nr:penicillin-binding protein activator LpoB [Culturomica sp.]
MRRLSILFILVAFVFVGYSQDTPVKKVMLVDKFTRASKVSENYANMLRNAIISGIENTGQITVIDVNSEEALKLEAERRAAESAISDATARTEMMTTKGAQLIMTGDITEMSGIKKKFDDGSIYYDGLINFSLKVTNASDGTVKASKNFTYSGLNAKTGSTPQDAVLNTTDYIKISMRKFVRDNFPLEATVLSIEKINKKKEAEIVYINCGSSFGIDKGHTFDVKVEREVAGKTVQPIVGKLKVTEVHGEDMALAKVVKGGSEIKKAFDEGRKIILIHTGGSALKGIGEGVGAFFK